MVKVAIAILFVLTIAMGGKSYYKSQQAQKVSEQLAEQKRKDDLQAQLVEARTKQEAAEAQLALVEAEKKRQEEYKSEAVLATHQDGPKEESPDEVRKKNLEENARIAVKNGLKDPISADFKITKVRLDVLNLRGDKKFDLVCGEVNAKNGFGGYTGFKRFYWDASGGAVLDEGEIRSILLEDLWKNWCA